MKASRKLFGLALMTLSLTACMQYSQIPVQNVGLNTIKEYHAAYSENRFEVKWSPDGKLIAIRMHAPDMSLIGAKVTLPFKRPQDVLQIFDADSGRLVAAWTPETSVAESTSLEAFRKSDNLNLQWSADSSKVFVLEPKTAHGMLQSLVLFSFDVSAARLSTPRPYGSVQPYAVRDIVFPDSLRKAGTLKLSQPSLSPDGTKLALYRESQPSGSELAEVMQMDLISGEAKSLGQLKGAPLESPLWGPKSGQVYVASNDRSLNNSWMQRFSSNAEPELLLSVATPYGQFSLSPDERFVLAALDTQSGALSGVRLNPALNEQDPEIERTAYSGHSYSFVGFLHDLTNGEEHYFKSPVFARKTSDNNYVQTDQSVWDYRNNFNYISYAKDSMSRLDPSQKISSSGVSLSQPQNVFKGLIKPFLTDPGNFAFGTSMAKESISFEVLAFSPKDSRMVLGGFSGMDIPLERFNLFHIWHPEQQKMLSLETSYLDLTDNNAMFRVIGP